MKKVLSLILCALLLLSAAACGRGSAGAEAQPAQTEAVSAAASEAKAQPEETARQITGHYADISPEILASAPLRLDPAEFYALCGELERLCAAGTAGEAFAVYEKMNAVLRQAYSATTLALTRYAENVTDEGAQDDYIYADSLLAELENEMLEAGQLAAAAFGERFRAYLGNDRIYQRYLDFCTVPEGINGLETRDAELVTEYYSRCADKGSYTCSYAGTEYSLTDAEYDALAGTLGEAASDEIYAACMKAFNADIGAIFLEMVQVRTEIARLYGYESYADYADEMMYFRDYDRTELQAFYDGIRPAAGDWQRVQEPELLLPETDTDAAWIAAQLAPLVAALPQTEQDAFRSLLDNGLLVVGTGEKFMSGGYSDSIPTADTALICGHLSGTAYDFEMLLHELGHFTETQENGFEPMDTLNLDVAEIHSTGTEALMLDQYGLVFSEDEAQAIKADELSTMLMCVVNGCMYDEWQRTVYDHPDMTLDEINEAFDRIAQTYGRAAEPWLPYDWVRLRHSFEVPMYYISYATSAVAALQIYELARTDRDAAEAAWGYILDCGASAAYMETVAGAGLVPFTDTEFTVELFRRCTAELTALLTGAEA